MGILSGSFYPFFWRQLPGLFVFPQHPCSGGAAGGTLPFCRCAGGQREGTRCSLSSESRINHPTEGGGSHLSCRTNQWNSLPGQRDQSEKGKKKGKKQKRREQVQVTDLDLGEELQRKQEVPPQVRSRGIRDPLGSFPT